MKNLAKVAIVVGIMSLVAGVVLRLSARAIVLGLEPSSFLEFSIACFLLTLALDTLK